MFFQKKKYIFKSLGKGVNPLPGNKFTTGQNLKSADDNFIFNENFRKFSKRVENTVGK